MGDYSEAFVGLDTSKLRNAVAIADASRGGEVRFLGEIENTPAATAKLIRKLSARYERLTFCYEAGPTGYGLHRQIKDLGFECVVVAPSLIPKRPGDKVKTNRRDALSLAKLLRADELTAVWVPDGRHEAVRDLTRARETAMLDLRTKRQHVGLSAAAGKALSREQEDLDQGACELDREPEARASATAPCAGGDDAGDPSGAGAAATLGAGHRGGASRMVAGRGGHGIEGDARDRSDLGRNVAGRDRRSL